MIFIVLLYTLSYGMQLSQPHTLWPTNIAALNIFIMLQKMLLMKFKFYINVNFTSLIQTVSLKMNC